MFLLLSCTNIIVTHIHIWELSTTVCHWLTLLSVEIFLRNTPFGVSRGSNTSESCAEEILE